MKPQISSLKSADGPDLLLRHFNSLADTPNALLKLRNLVLRLAVRGRLVLQDPKDTLAPLASPPATAERKNARGKGKDCSRAWDAPFESPTGWQWARFDRVATIASNLVQPNHFSALAHIAPDNLEKGTGRLLPFHTVREDGVRSPNHHFFPGQLLYSKIRPNLAKVVLVDFEGLCSADMYPVDVHIYPPYLLYYMLSDVFMAMAVRNDTRVAMPKINQEELNRILVAVPPLPEQRRIVAKVEELLALCDELEARQTTAREHRTRLTHSALDHLTTAKDEQDFQKRASFILHKSPFILEDVPALRQAILSLAVQGHLVRQNAAEGNGSQQIERMDQARKLRRTSTDQARIDMSPIPKNWGTALIDDLFEVVGGIQKTPLRAPRANAFPYLRVANVQRGRLILDNIQHFELFEGDLERWGLRPDDLLVVEGNGSEDEIGRCARWNGEISDCVHQNHIIRCRPIGHDAAFILLFLNSPLGIAEMKARAITTSGLYSLSVGKIRNVPVPFPPLPEQRRIVAKVEELMRWCDQLETRLATARANAEKLMDALLRKLTTSPKEDGDAA